MPVYLLPVLAFLKAHWRPCAAAALLVAAFVGGRWSVPKPTTKVETRVEYRDRVVTQIVEKKADDRQTAKTVVVYRDRVTHKDGTIEEKTSVQKTQGTAEHHTDGIDTTTTATRAGTETSTKTVTAAPPAWSVSVSLGVPVALKAPFVGTPFVVGEVDRRVWGPLYLGAWGSVDIHGKNPVAGLSMGVAF